MASRAKFATPRVAVTATFGIHGLLIASWTAHIPSVQAHLGLSDGTLGVALLGMPIGSVSAVLLAGRLLPRLGSRRLVRICLVGYCLSGALSGVAGSLAALFAALLLWGAFQGMLDVSMNSQAIVVAQVAGRPLMSGWHGCWSLGALTGAGFGALGVALGLSLVPQLLIMGIPALLIGQALDTRLLPDPPTPGRTSGSRPWRFRLRGGAALIVPSRCSSSGASPWPTCSAKEPPLMAMSTLVFAATLTIGDTVAALIGYAALGVGLASVVPAVFGAAGRLPGCHGGSALSTVAAFGWAGFVCGPPLIGQLASAFSLPVALGLIPVLTAFVAIVTATTTTLDTGAETAAHGAPPLPHAATTTAQTRP
jgi:hypothetical protein